MPEPFDTYWSFEFRQKFDELLKDLMKDEKQAQNQKVTATLIVSESTKKKFIATGREINTNAFEAIPFEEIKN
jgi:hypothetical protein